MHLLQIGLVLTFGSAGAACFVAIRGVSRVPDADARRGLAALLLLSGLWAVSEAGRLLVPSPLAKEMIYVLGLVVGLPTVGAWLYFCSAYTGHDYHRRPVFRRLAVVVYALVVGLKLTNPYHGLYFKGRMVSEPFPHLALQLMPAHWVITGLSYALTAIGFYLLYELFSRSSLQARSLSVLVAVTGLPAVLDILGYTGTFLLMLNYEPIGVAVFAVGVLYVVDEQFAALPAFWRQDVLEAIDDPVLVFDRDGTVRAYNTAATARFPDLGHATGQPLETAYPTLAAELANGADLVETDSGAATKHYAVEQQDLAIEDKRFGRAVILSDITLIEQQRRKLKRQNDQFDDFAEAITHELRNTLTITKGYVDLLNSKGEHGPQSRPDEFHGRVTDAIDRMDRIVTDLSKLARYGQSVHDRDQCDLRETARQGWTAAETDGMSLSIETDGTLHCDETRMTDLFKNAFEFARATDATTVSVSMTDAGTVIASDGDGLPRDEIDRALSYGEAVPSAETGMLLPNVRTIARAHGWQIDATVDDAGGMSLSIETT